MANPAGERGENWIGGRPGGKTPGTGLGGDRLGILILAMAGGLIRVRDHGGFIIRGLYVELDGTKHEEYSLPAGGIGSRGSEMWFQESVDRFARRATS